MIKWFLHWILRRRLIHLRKIYDTDPVGSAEYIEARLAEINLDLDEIEDLYGKG